VLGLRLPNNVIITISNRQQPWHRRTHTHTHTHESLYR